MGKFLSFFMIIVMAAGLSACSKDKNVTSIKNEPVVMEITQTKIPAPRIDSTLLVAGADSRTEAVSTTIRLKKSQLLNRAFLYGASLQFSSIVEDDLATAMMGLSLGQVPAEFKIFGNKLRLVSDSRISFESDVNHPSRLIHEFPILSQDSESLTIKTAEASPILATALFGNKAPATVTSWIRSLEFVKEDELFLIESSLELNEGSLGEVMETIRPRDKVVPENFEPIYDDEDLNEDATRFRFLDAGIVFVDHPENGRVQTAVAQRFNVMDGKPVSWFITRNIPDTYMADIKNAVEGWNRYSQLMWKKDIVKFEGRLPEGIKVGDPRYNLIIWDTVRDAGAAYESQNSDPITGMQLHSMIYLPSAWVNIAKDYWTNANYSEDEQEAKVKKTSKFLKNKSFMGRRLPVNCLEPAHRHVSLLAKENLDEFSRSLLKGVLFHEMGHALGLAHNFKGSLSFNPDNKESGAFTTSIMDYNNYNEEVGAFSNVNSAEGPILEYDRQILSVLYNEGKDIQESDAELPACDDEESDSLAEGVDPLCVRYDIGNDPTKVALRGLELLADPAKRNGRMSSLPLALPRILKDLPDASKATTIKEASAGVAKGLLLSKGVTAFYVGDAYRSIINALRSLHVIRPDTLPEEYNEEEMRGRTLSALEQLMQINAYPEATKLALAQVRIGIQNWILSTPAFAKMGENDRSVALTALMTKVDASFKAMETAQLSKMRARVAAELTYTPEAPFSFYKFENQVLDTEALVIGYLKRLAIEQNRPLSERSAGLTALATFKNENGTGAMKELKTSLEQEIRTTQDAMKREELRKFLAALS